MSLDDRASGMGLRPDDAAIVRQGAGLYAEHCAGCHGRALEGHPDWQEPLPNGRLRPPPHDQSGHTWHHAGRLLFELTKYGTARVVGDGYESDMPAYESVLDDEEILAVLSYIKSTWSEEIRHRHDRLESATRGPAR
jgi:mono/diheme cytochrome c family protein